MRKPIMQGIRPFSMLIFTTLLVITVGLLFQAIGMLTAAPLFGIRLAEMLSLDPVNHVEQLNALKYIQIIGALGTFIFSSLLLSFLYTGNWFEYFTFRRAPGVFQVVLLSAIMISAFPFINFLTEWNTRMTLPFDGLEAALRTLEEETEEVMMLLVKADNAGVLALNLFMIAILPAVGEELVFRGLIQRHLNEWFRNGHLAVLVTSVIFSLVHFQVYSFLPRFFLGLLLGYMMLYGRSVWYPIIAHFINNAIGVVFYYLYFRDQAGTAIEDIGTQDMMPITALFSFLLVAGMMVFWIVTERISRTARTS